MKDRQIVVTKECESLWFTAQERRFGFLTRGKWVSLYPMKQPTYEKAEKTFGYATKKESFWKKVRRFFAPTCPDCNGKIFITDSDCVGANLTNDYNIYTCDNCGKQWC